MTIAVWITMVVMFSYTIGFSITLWKGKSKVGAISVFILAIAIVVTPFFSVLNYLIK